MQNVLRIEDPQDGRIHEFGAPDIAAVTSWYDSTARGKGGYSAARELLIACRVRLPDAEADKVAALDLADRLDAEWGSLPEDAFPRLLQMGGSFIVGAKMAPAVAERIDLTGVIDGEHLDRLASLGVSKETVRDWISGTRKPELNLRLLYLPSDDYALVKAANSSLRARAASIRASTGSTPQDGPYAACKYVVLNGVKWPGFSAVEALCNKHPAAVIQLYKEIMSLGGGYREAEKNIVTS